MPLDLTRIPPFNAEQFARVCELVADGATRDEAIRQAGIHRLTFCTWLDANPALNRQWLIAKRASAYACDQAARDTLATLSPANEHMRSIIETRARDYRIRSAQLYPDEFAIMKNKFTPRGVERVVRPRSASATPDAGHAALIAASPSDD